jgi:hypothetical protein
VTTGELHIFDGKTTVPAPLRPASPTPARPASSTTSSIPTAFEFVFVEIELKA